MNPSPTDPIAVQEWMESLGFTLLLGEDVSCYFRPSSALFIEIEQAAFFYNVVQQQILTAQIKELNRAKREGYIPHELLYKVDRRIQALEAALNQHNAPEGGDSV